MIDFFSLENHDNLDHYNDEFLGGREEIYIDLKGLKHVETETIHHKKLSTVLGNLISRINPVGVPPSFMTIVASERPSVLAEVKEDMTPIFVAGDRQGILWTRNVFIINGQKVAQSGHDGSQDNILPASIMGPDVISFGYIFDGTDWDRIRSLADNVDNLASGNPGHVATMAKLLGYDGVAYDRVRVGSTDADNVAALSAGVLQTAGHLYGFDGTTWDRIGSGANNADDIAVSTSGILSSNSFMYSFGGTNWDRVRGNPTNSDNIATVTEGMLSVLSFMAGFDGTTFDRIRSGSNAGDAIATNAAGNMQVLSYNLGFNGTTYDRIRSDQYNANALAAGATGGLVVNAILRVWNGASFNLPLAEANNADGAGTSATADKLITLANLRAFNGTTWDRIRSGGNNADAVATTTLGVLHAKAHGAVSNGTTWDLAKSASAANQSTAASTTLAGVQLATQPGNWSVNNFPATATQATVSRAAGGVGIRHVCTGFTFSCSGAAAAATGLLQAVIRDGTTGAGTIIWTASIQAPLADSKDITIGGLSLVGTANTAMTIEFTAAGAAGTQESVTMYGYSVA